MFVAESLLRQKNSSLHHFRSDPSYPFHFLLFLKAEKNLCILVSKDVNQKIRRLLKRSVKKTTMSIGIGLDKGKKWQGK